MDHRQLGSSRLPLPAPDFGTHIFGRERPLFSVWGQSTAEEARHLIDIWLQAGVTLFGTTDIYSRGASEVLPAYFATPDPQQASFGRLAQRAA